jgi:hypothetical protein
VNVRLLLRGAGRKIVYRLDEVSILDVSRDVSTPRLDALLGVPLLLEDRRKPPAEPCLDGFREVGR